MRLAQLFQHHQAQLLITRPCITRHLHRTMYRLFSAPIHSPPQFLDMEISLHSPQSTHTTNQPLLALSHRLMRPGYPPLLHLLPLLGYNSLSRWPQSLAPQLPRLTSPPQMRALQTHLWILPPHQLNNSGARKLTSLCRRSLSRWPQPTLLLFRPQQLVTHWQRILRRAVRFEDASVSSILRLQ